MIKIIFHRGPMQQGSIAAFSTELVVFCNDFTAKHSQPDHCPDGHAFIWRIAAGRVQVLFGKGPFTFRVDEDEVGIAAGQQRPFARVQAKNFRHIGTGDLDEPFQGQPPFQDAFAEQQGHPFFNAGYTAGTLAEIADILLFFSYRKGTVVRRHRLYGPLCQGLP